MKCIYGMATHFVAAFLDDRTSRAEQSASGRERPRDARRPGARGYIESPYSMAILGIAAALATAPWLFYPADSNRSVARMADRRLELYMSPASPKSVETPEKLFEQLDALTSGDPERRAVAVRSLGFGDDSVAAAAVARALYGDPDSRVRAAAARALATHNDSVEAVGALVYALRDADAQVREQALFSLSAIRDERVESELRAVLVSRVLGEETAGQVRSFLSRYYRKS